MKLNKDSTKTPHFRCEISENVIIHHNPKIIKRIANSLSNVKKVTNKNYYILQGTYEDKKITLITTGMGACNTGMIVDQITSQGTKHIFKFGTYGALQDKIEIGDLFIPNGAVRSDGLTDAYAPLYYPAVPDSDLYLKLIKKAQELKIKTRNGGIIHSVNIYSPYYETTSNPAKYSPDMYRGMGVTGVEMETSTAFICSSVKKAKCVAILVCNRDWRTQEKYKNGENAEWDQHQRKDEKTKATQNAIKLILETIKEL